MGDLVLASVSAVIASIGIIVSLLLLAWQNRELAKQTRIGNQVGAIAAASGAIDRIHRIEETFLKHPELREYFYENKPPPADRPLRQRLQTIAAMYADHVEQGLLILDMHPFLVDYHAVREFGSFLLGNSPVLREVRRANPEFWPRLARLRLDVAD